MTLCDRFVNLSSNASAAIRAIYPVVKKQNKKSKPLSVAGNGLLDRRAFLSLIGGAATVPFLPPSVHADTQKTAFLLPSQTKPGADFRNYGTPSVYEKSVIRWISANREMPGNGVSWTPLHQLEGTITPNGLHFERHHNGVPDIDPDSHHLLIHGDVAEPRRYSMERLLRYPRVSKICFVECGGNSNSGWNPKPIQAPAGLIHGLVSCSEWSGIPLSFLLDEVGIREKEIDNLWIDAQGADAGSFHVSIPMAKAIDDGLLALYQNGERLRPENGYPMRLILPGFEAVTHVKWVHRLNVVRKPVMARDETAKYTELIPGGFARQFTFKMAPKSLILSPSYGIGMDRPGIYAINGIAWSGDGKIKRVEVSADGGTSWADADLDGPILPHAFVRFRIPWHWRGQPAILKSRATDESGRIQPERDDLIAKRGRFGYFHYHAIVSWKIDPQGYVSHVYG